MTVPDWFVLDPYYGGEIETLIGPFATEDEAKAYIARERLNWGYVRQAQEPNAEQRPFDD